jgi:hypothetical protein
LLISQASPVSICAADAALHGPLGNALVSQQRQRSPGFNPGFLEEELAMELEWMFAPLLVAILVILAMTGCTTGTPTPSYQADFQAVQEAQPDRNPLEIVLFKDQTPSRYTNGVPELSESDFETPLRLLQRYGGDLAIGWIRDQSNKPLMHCHFDEPPIPNAQKPQKKGNVFLREKATKKYAQDLHKDASLVSEWRQGNQKSLVDCRATIKEALQWHPDAPRTDIAGALRRAQLVFGEPQDSWLLPPQHYLVMVTDGFGNVSGPAPEMLLSTKLLLVNSAGTLGTLEPFKPLRFENLASAFRFIASDSAGLKQPNGGE